MAQFYLISIAAGLASGVLHFAQAMGSLGGILLGFVATLPIFLVGLSLSGTAALIAGIAGGIVAMLTGGLPYAALYFIFYALPSAFLCRQALLSRTGPTGDIEWYPPGQLVLCLTGISTGFFLIVLIGLEIFADGLLPAIEVLLGAFVANMPPDVTMPETFVAENAPMVPVVAVASWIVMIFLNGVLAQSLLVRFERNYRPSPKLADITYPSWFIAVFAGAILASYLQGNFALIGKTLAVIGAVAYFLLGLGVLQSLFHRFSVGWLPKILFYGFVLPVVWPITLVLVVVGIVRHVNQLRRPNDDGQNGGRKET
jgi:uncharacterized membrane protein